MPTKPVISLLTILLFFGNSSTIAADTALSLGDYLSARGNYDAAITEYGRFLFFQPDDPRAGEIYYKIGLAYRAQGMLPVAIKALRTITQHT